MDLQNISELSQTTLVIIGLVLAWELIWKGLALWKAGRRNQPIWFVVLLVINTAGILPIIYLLISKDKAV